MYGELVPVGGGDTIPLLKKTLLVGRRESCDIVLRFPNVSAHHCQLQIDSGYWYVRDQKSRNGLKVNGTRVTEKRLDPGDMLSIATHRYTVQYSPADLGAVGPPPSSGAPIQKFSPNPCWSEPDSRKPREAQKRGATTCSTTRPDKSRTRISLSNG